MSLSHACKWSMPVEGLGITGAGINCTIFGVVLSILLEWVTHWDLDSISRSSPEPCDSASSDAAEDVELLPLETPPEREHEQKQKQHESTADELRCLPKEIPTPRTRTTRFALGFVLYAGVVTLFSFRIHEATDKSRIPSACRGQIGLDSSWVAITFFNIVPFLCATMAIVRALVDCVLVEYGTFLGNGRSERGAMVWRPFVPILGLWFVVLGLCGLVVEGVKVLVAMVMGRRGDRNADGEIRGDEERGLIENVDGGQDEDGEESPAYEETVGTEVVEK